MDYIKPKQVISTKENAKPFVFQFGYSYPIIFIFPCRVSVSKNHKAHSDYNYMLLLTTTLIWNSSAVGLPGNKTEIIICLLSQLYNNELLF